MNDKLQGNPEINRRFYIEWEHNEFRSLLMEIYTAYTSGALRMTSHRVGDPDNGIPMGPWHEEWMTGVREALGENGDE